MLQPFELLKLTYIDRLIQMKIFYLVSQSYRRAIDHFTETQKCDILVTDYEDIGLAKIHVNAVSHDKYAAIIDLKNGIHLNKLRSMLDPASNYTMYWSVVKDARRIEQRLDYRYKDHIRRYISKNTNWRVGADQKIRPSFQIIFGELFTVLKYANQTLRIKFEEIEKA